MLVLGFILTKSDHFSHPKKFIKPEKLHLDHSFLLVSMRNGNISSTGGYFALVYSLEVSKSPNKRLPIYFQIETDKKPLINKLLER